MTDSVIGANRLTASNSILSQGGRLYTVDPLTGEPFPVSISQTVLEANKPDQCVGC